MKKLKLSDFKECIFPKNKYKYLGYTYWDKDSLEFEFLLEFYKAVDKVARPWWCPKLILRFTHLLGNDNSIVRVRIRWIHNLHLKLTKGIQITDLKWKFDSFCIYGYFTPELDNLADEICNKIEKYAKN